MCRCGVRSAGGASPASLSFLAVFQPQVPRKSIWKRHLHRSDRCSRALSPSLFLALALSPYPSLLISHSLSLALALSFSHSPLVKGRFADALVILESPQTLDAITSKQKMAPAALLKWYFWRVE